MSDSSDENRTPSGPVAIYSLTSHRTLTEKLPLLRRLGIAPAIVFDTPDSASMTALRAAHDVSADFAPPPLVHLPYRGFGDPTGRLLRPQELQLAAHHALTAGFQTILMHSFIEGDDPDPPASALAKILPAVQQITKAHGRVIVENTFDANLDMFLWLVKGLDVHVGIDPPRLRLSGQDAHKWVGALRDRVAAIHAYGSTGEDTHSAIHPRDAQDVAAIAAAVRPEMPNVLLDVPREDLALSARLLQTRLVPK